ncbi:MAG TPA: hypothetical protein VMW27_01640 [Thermoanaerobaculia bacterium]|nr:hypothetical protein [Thermoanaerobaculia bacterium]
MRDGLLTLLFLFAMGSQAVLPWRAVRLPAEARRPWGYALLPLLLAAALAALLWVRFHPDATLAAGLLPLATSKVSKILGVLTAALALADVVALAGWRKMEDAGWRLLAGFGLAALGAACFAAELLRAGEGPASPDGIVALAAACRMLVALAAGEIAAPGRPLVAVAAGLALPAWFLAIPAELSSLLLRNGAAFPAGAAAVLFLAVRWLPARLRRPALAAAALLAAILFAQAATLSQTLAAPLQQAMPPLPGM